MSKRVIVIGFDEGEKGIFSDTFEVNGFKFERVRVVLDFIYNRYIFTFYTLDDSVKFYHFEPTYCYKVPDKRYELDFEDIVNSFKIKFK